MIGDYNNMNPYDTNFTAGARDVVGMWVKSENSGQAFNIRLYVYTSAGVKIINYHSNAVTESLNGSVITARIPGQSLSAFANGQWHYIELPVTQTLQQWIPGATVGSGSSGVVGMLFNGKRLFVDDIVISSTKLDRSYQVIPGAAISGVLGSFTGSNVVADAGNRVRYFHYNDLGTVMAQTKTGGIVEGVWEPDWWGNYRWAYPGSPARPELGLTGKMYDETAGLYYFNARWYDPERGRWMSESPLSPLMEQQFAFNMEAPVNFADPTGLWGEDVHRGDTYIQCRLAGGSKCSCRIIADSNQGFDESWNSTPWLFPELHFPQELRLVGGKLLSAISSCDAEAFGRALHQYQDYFAHVYPGNKGSSGEVIWLGGPIWIPPNHIRQGHDPDRVHKHPVEHDLTMRSTFNWSKRFIENCSGGDDCENGCE